MPPKQIRTSKAEAAQPNYVQSVYQTITSQENRSVVTAAGMFVVGVAFLHSSLSEFLIPA